MKDSIANHECKNNKIFVDYFYAVFIFLTVAIPSSTVLGIPFKDIVLFIILIFYLMKGEFFINVRIVYWLLILFVFVGFYSLLAFSLDYTVLPMLGQMKMLASTVMPIALFYFLGIDKRKESKKMILRIIVWAIIFYFAVKMSLLILPFYINIKTPDLYTLLFQLPANQWEVMPGFYRSQYINDTVIIFLYFFVLIAFKGIKKTNIILLTISVIGITLISFSRFNLIIFSVMLLFFLMVFLKFRILFFLFLCVFVISLLNIDLVNQYLNVRTSVVINEHSDSARWIQFGYLLDMIYDRPFLGYGFSAYSPNYIRGGNGLEFLYEMQLFSFIMQFGILGFAIISLILLTPLFYLYSKIPFRDFCLTLLVYLSFIVSCITNPYLLSGVSGVIFLMVTNSIYSLTDE